MFTFCPTLDQPVTTNFLEEIEDVPEEMWHYDKFRNCLILPLWNPSAQIGVVDPSIKGEFRLTEAAMLCPQLMSFVLPICEKLRGRLTVLKTPPDWVFNVHMDSRIDEIGTEQYKWRMVLKGEKDGLFFLDQNQERVFPNSGFATYVIDGSHPHSLKQSNEEKITVCIGAPWRGSPMVDLMEDEKVSVPRGNVKEEWGIK